MNGRLFHLVLAASLVAVRLARAELSADELTTLANQVRASVMFMIVSDDAGHVIASGTGFIVSADGKLITNRHVADAGPRIVAKSPSGRQYRVLGALAEDSDQDLVVLQLEDSRLSPLPLGASDSLNVGTPVVMVGNPLAMESTVQQGTVSGFRQFLGTRRWIEISAAVAKGREGINSRVIHGQGLQVTTAVAHGSSGSPVLTPDGQVIGVITAIETGEQTLALAIPVETVKDLVARAARADGPKSLNTLTKRSGSDLSTDPDFGAAVDAYNAGDFETAERRAKTVVARYPDSAGAHLLLGQVYLQRKSFSEAADSFERVIRLKRDLASAWAGLAVAYVHLGLQDRARDAVRELQKLDPARAKKLIDSSPELAP